MEFGQGTDGKEVSSTSIRTLIVEDDPTTRALIEAYVRRTTEDYTSFSNAEEALDVHQGNPADLLIVDWTAPGMDGLELCRRVRALPGGRRPVILVTSRRKEPSEVHQALDAGADDYLPKPLNGSTLGIRLAVAGRSAAERAQRGDAQEQLRRREREVHELQRMESLGRLAGGVAHDFNNLLMTISGFAELVASELEVDDGRREDLLEIQKAAQRGSTLSKQLLAFSRRQIQKRTTFDLQDAVKDIGELTRRVINPSIAVHIRPSSEPCGVHADRVQLEQVLMNLVLNACDAMPGGGAITIRASTVALPARSRNTGERPGRYCMVSVRDTGKGISPEIRARIFDPFFTTKPRGAGMGLGLSTAYGIVKQSGGHISVDCPESGGTVFRVYLPLVQVELPNKGHQRGATEPRTPSETLLLVEDDTPIRRLTSRALTSAGYEVLEACNGREALQVYEESGGVIDLLLTDVVMPELDGQELAQRLRATNPDIPVLFMSGYPETLSDLELSDDSRSTFLPKPCSTADLLAEVEHLLEAGWKGEPDERASSTAQEP